MKECLQGKVLSNGLINGVNGGDRLGAACDFQIVDLERDRLLEWILKQQLPFDSLYYYGSDRQNHISCDW